MATVSLASSLTRSMGIALLTALLITACNTPKSGAIADSDPGANSNSAVAATASRPPGSLTDWLSDMRTRVKTIPEKFATDAVVAQQAVMDVYITRQEYVEAYYGAAGVVSKGGQLGDAVMVAETMFHDLMKLVGATPKSDVSKVRVLTDSIDAQLAKVAKLAVDAKVPLTPPDTLELAVHQRPDLSKVIALAAQARALHLNGHTDSARALVEHAYLEEFEPLEPLLPSESVAKVERLVHGQLKPMLAGNADRDRIDSLFAVLGTELTSADASMRGDRSGWFGVLSSFLIIVREGLEAVLLIAAMVAYLSRSSETRAQRKNVYAGAAAGLVATFATWIVARTLLPITGGGRELMEGITALIAVAVLLYVSHWIFQRTYIGGWKNFLHGKVARAISAGSGLAIAGLSFAAVYREGFETVLFYQALVADLPASSVLLGFASGAVVIAAVGFGIIRLGVKLPLQIVFKATTAVLLFLSVAILGKGLYNLQEAGLFNPHPLEWLPNSAVLRQVLGFYPIAETLLAQLALITLVVVMYWVYRRRAFLERARATA